MSALLACQATARSRGREGGGKEGREGGREKKKGEHAREGGVRGSETRFRQREF